MAQFDVFANANSRTVKQFPYLLEVQLNLFEDANRAVYIRRVSERTLKKPMKYLTLHSPLRVNQCGCFHSTYHPLHEAQWESWWVTYKLKVIQS